MKNLLLSLVLLFPISATLAQEQPDLPAPQKESAEDKIRRLVGELGEDSYQAREKAQAALEKMGKPALEALRKAAKSIDLEVSSRARELIEKITGNKIDPDPKAGPKKDAGPLVPPSEPMPFNSDDLKDILDQLKGFEKLSPNLKKTLDSFRKLLEGKKGDEQGIPSLPEMGDLFKQFFGKNKTEKAEPDRLITPALSEIERSLHITVQPIDDVLRSHVIVTPGWANKKTGYWANPKQLKQGLVITSINSKGPAFAQGLRMHDILIFAGQSKPPESPWVTSYWPAWLKWREASASLAKPEDLNTLASGKTFIEVVRKGKSGQTVQVSLPGKSVQSLKKTKDF